MITRKLLWDGYQELKKHMRPDMKSVSRTFDFIYDKDGEEIAVILELTKNGNKKSRHKTFRGK
jgi:hypothetical protein